MFRKLFGNCVEACCEPRNDDYSSEQEWPSLGLAADGTFNSQVKAAGSREKEKNKRGTTYFKRKQDPRGQTSPVEDIDQIIKEFTRNDAVSTATAAAKGVQQTVDAAVEHKKNKMSPVREEQSEMAHCRSSTQHIVKSFDR